MRIILILLFISHFSYCEDPSFEKNPEKNKTGLYRFTEPGFPKNEYHNQFYRAMNKNAKKVFTYKGGKYLEVFMVWNIYVPPSFRADKPPGVLVSHSNGRIIYSLKDIAEKKNLIIIEGNFGLSPYTKKTFLLGQDNIISYQPFVPFRGLEIIKERYAINPKKVYCLGTVAPLVDRKSPFSGYIISAGVPMRYNKIKKQFYLNYDTKMYLGKKVDERPIAVYVAEPNVSNATLTKLTNQTFKEYMKIGKFKNLDYKVMPKTKFQKSIDMAIDFIDSKNK